MATKRNFWIKLNEHFFKDPRIEYLLNTQGGEGAVIIYQKLLLKGMNAAGNVFFFNERRCDVKFIASAMGVKPAKLRKCIDLLIDMELVVWREDGSFYLPELVYMVGSESGSAPRMRRKRERDASHNADSSTVTCDTDIEKEKELKKEVESEMNCSPFVRQYGILKNKWGVIIMPKGKPHKRYTAEFKEHVIKTMLEEKLSYTATSERFEINSHNRIQSWERIYLEEGPEGFKIERRGRGSTGRPRKLPKEVEEDLLAEVQRLRAENEYLKNLQALVLEDERRQRKERR